MPAPLAASKKRKAVTKDVEEEDHGVMSGDEFHAGIVGNRNPGELEIGILDNSSDEESDDEYASAGKRMSLGSVLSEDEEPHYTISKDANGNERYVYDEINPDDNSDYSEADEGANTIGDIPLSFYDQYPHIGYTVNGKKIMRPAKGEALDALLNSIEIPAGWTGMTDPITGKSLEVSQEELELLKKVQMNEVTQEGYDPYQPTVEYFTGKEEIMPLSAAPEPKRRFVPSKHEARRVMKIVKAIREGRILPYKPADEDEESAGAIRTYDLWANDAPGGNHPIHTPAPKLPPPGYEESYHPPPEYLPDQKERDLWNKNKDTGDNEKSYLPTDYDSLRKVPGYETFVKEKFERCLDLYLAPRIRRSKLNIDPESLLPKLPSPEELKPFPTTCATLFRGHRGRVRSLAIDPSGLWLATAGDDGTVRIWELLSGRQLWIATLSKDEPINAVCWRPGTDTTILSVVVGEEVYLIVPDILDPEIESATHDLLDEGWGYASANQASKKSDSLQSTPPPQWVRPQQSLANIGVYATIPLKHNVKSISWHRRGNYFVTVCPGASTPASLAIAIHTLSKHLTQYPFRRRLKGGGPPQAAHFHPSKPILFVANQRVIRSYDLSRQTLVKILQPGARWISSFDIHPTSPTTVGGDNLIVGSYDRRLLWHDIELSNRPYKTLRYHSKAIRAVKYHPHRPLFADCSDDGSLQIFHGSVTGDLLSNANIVPLKVLRGHKVTGELGVLDIDWHPKEAWCVSAGADGSCRLWM